VIVHRGKAEVLVLNDPLDFDSRDFRGIGSEPSTFAPLRARSSKTRLAHAVAVE
jgi:hypothetical protein